MCTDEIKTRKEEADDLTRLIRTLLAGSQPFAPTSNKKAPPKKKANDIQGLTETAKKLQAMGSEKAMALNACENCATLRLQLYLKYFLLH